jgi:flagellar basal-body rod protein FlgB
MMETAKLRLLSHAMQAYSHRMQAHTGNIANLDTPDYQRRSVSFEDRLQQAMSRNASPDQVDDVQARTRVEDSPPVLEDELMELADTQMRSQLAVRALRDHFDLLRTGILGRSG